MSYHAYMLHIQQRKAARRERQEGTLSEPWEDPVLTPEQQTRKARVDLRALQVFGDRMSAGVWCHCPNTSAFGSWISPWELAQQSEEGCRIVLAELDRVARDMAADYGTGRRALAQQQNALPPRQSDERY